MHLLISIAVSFGMLILGLAILVALQARGINPVGRVAALFTPAAASSQGATA